jgi:hypothetical protein
MPPPPSAAGCGASQKPPRICCRGQSPSRPRAPPWQRGGSQDCGPGRCARRKHRRQWQRPRPGSAAVWPSAVAARWGTPHRRASWLAAMSRSTTALRARASIHVSRIAVGGEAGVPSVRGQRAAVLASRSMRAEAFIVSLATISGRIPRMWVMGDRVLDPGGGEPGIEGLPCSRGS